MIEKPPKKRSTKKINEYKLKNSIKLTQVRSRYRSHKSPYKDCWKKLKTLQNNKNKNNSHKNTRISEHLYTKKSSTSLLKKMQINKRLNFIPIKILK